MIIGITGPLGAGKDTVADYIAKRTGGAHVSGGDVLRHMLTTIGLDPKKTALGDFGTFLRTHYGHDVIIQAVLRQTKGAKHSISSGFRSPVEAQAIKDRGGVIVYIDCPDTVRHDRVIRRNRAHDTATIEAALKLDKQEGVGDSLVTENLAEVRKLVDYTIVNDGTPEELYKKVDQLIVDLNL